MAAVPLPRRAAPKKAKPLCATELKASDAAAGKTRSSEKRRRRTKSDEDDRGTARLDTNTGAAGEGTSIGGTHATGWERDKLTTSSRASG